MEVDNVLKALNACVFGGCKECPYRIFRNECSKHMLTDTIKVLEEYADGNKSYEKRRHELLLEDAQSQLEYYFDVADDYMCNYPDFEPDYEELVRMFEERESAYTSFNETWQDVCYDYVRDNGLDV